MQWIPISERVPDHSDKVLITDGKNVSTAHYFSATYDPRTKARGGPQWANQHELLTGGWIDTPTHWIETAAVLATVPK